MEEKLNKKSASKNSYLDYFLKVNKIINTIIHKYWTPTEKYYPYFKVQLCFIFIILQVKMFPNYYNKNWNTNIQSLY